MYTKFILKSIDETKLTINKQHTPQETLPNWDDEYDILASLRSHNYNSDLCISTFFAWGDMSEFASYCWPIVCMSFYYQAPGTTAAEREGILKI